MSAATKLLKAAAGTAAGGEAVYVDDLFSTYVYDGNGGTQGIPNGINLGDFGVGTSTRFNGTGDHLSRSSDLSGNSDGKTFTFSCWVFLPPMDDRAGNTNQRVLYATDSSDNGVAINVDSSGQLGIEAGDGSGSWKLQATALTAIGTNVWTHILVSVDMANSSNRYIYLNDVAASVNWNVYSNTNLDFTRSTHYIGVWGNGTARFFYDDMAHLYFDYTYRDLSTESNRRIFIDANGGSTSASSLAALNPIMYLPMTTAYAVGKNAGTGGDFTVSGSPRIVQNGTEYGSGEGKGGMVWFTRREIGDNHFMSDTVRGATKTLRSNTTAAESTDTTAVTSFTANGPVVGSDGSVNNSSGTFAAWTFRKQEKFFDVVTYTGNGTAGRTLSHNLGSVPGMIMIKRTDSTADWIVWHRAIRSSSPENFYLKLNSDTAEGFGAYFDGGSYSNVLPTSTEITLGDSSAVNASSGTYVAYLFAHDEQEFGENSDEAIIKCGSYTGNGSSTGPTIDLGFEPQWLMAKRTNDTGDWWLVDNMRGMVNGGNDAVQFPNHAHSDDASNVIKPTPTGFQLQDSGTRVNANGSRYIYVAIRRPHKPASEFAAADLFTPASQDFEPGIIPAGFPIDLIWHARHGTANYKRLFDRLRGATKGFYTDQTNADVTHSLFGFDNMTGFEILPGTTIDAWSWMMFRRAKGFLDVVAYEGTGSARTINHNLGAVPEMIWIKNRTQSGDDWIVYSSVTGATKYLKLNNNSSQITDSPTYGDRFNQTAPTASVFSVGTRADVNYNTHNYMAYLFASVEGISKVGSYTGTGSDVDVNCGFSSGARLVIVKRSDSTGGWYLWDSARGIVAGNDSYYLMNTNAAQVTNTDYIDPLASGFTITSSAPAELNASGGTYVFLAIA